MRVLSLVGAGLAAGLVWAPPTAAAPAQPPMNDFNEAFYTCDNGAAFAVSYDSTTPSTATLTASGVAQPYALKRTPSDTGAQFTGGTAKFWTDGKTVVVQGTPAPLKNCKMKTG